MNTSAFRSFALQARKDLKENVERKINYWGFDKNGKATVQVEAVTGGYSFRNKLSDDSGIPSKWNKLKAAIDETSFDEVVEKAAYTWFNRLMTMKILSKNGYEAAQLDYLSGETHTPAILERARRGQYNFLTSKEKQRLQLFLTDYEKEQEAFAILLIGYCHQHSLLNTIFGVIDDYTELLLPDNILTENGFLNFLNTTDAISDEDYKQVELIGWLYQFYFSEKKDELFAGFRQNKKADAKDIPAATQIFTPNWIVKYLVQNTLGRTWLDAHPDSKLRKNWKYLLESTIADQQPQTSDSTLQDPEMLTFLDPGVGSGHILVEAFDTLYSMYLAEYYSPEEAVKSILEKNLFGLDLDPQAVQLAQFAVILKAAQYSRTVLQGKTLPHIAAMPGEWFFSKDEVAQFLGQEYAGYTDQLYKALHTMEQVHNLGSIMVLEINDDVRKAVLVRYEYWLNKTSSTFEDEIIKQVFPAYVPILLMLTDKYACIAANPPYMGQRNMNSKLKSYINDHYPLAKHDLFAVFIEQMIRLTKNGGYIGCITMESWMFLSSYEEMRINLLANYTIKSLSHFGWHIIGIAFGTAAAIFKKEKPVNGHKGVYSYLEIEDIDQEKNIPFEFPLKTNGRFHEIIQSGFGKIPGSPIAYWISEREKNLYKDGRLLGNHSYPKKGLDTGENEIFLKLWQEVSFKKTSVYDSTVNAKWFPYNKGGEFRKWYGNRENLINWLENGKEIKSRLAWAQKKPTIRNPDYYFRQGFAWTTVSSGGFSARFSPPGSLFDNGGCTLFADQHLEYLGALINSVVGKRYLEFLSPTLNFQPGDISRILLFEDNDLFGEVETLVKKAIELARIDWDSREVSWDFQTNPILNTAEKSLEKAYQKWLQQASDDFFKLHAWEEELNRLFINIYGLQEELKPEVPLKEITLLQDELDYDSLKQLEKPYEGKLLPVNDKVMQQLISYIVGCYMGRYCLIKPGLHIAHPNPTEKELAPYFVQTAENKRLEFQIDDDAIIPVMGSNGNFTDDLLHRVKEFLTIVWGDDSLTINLNFLQQQLGRDLENYLVKDFWKYHVRIYSRKPVYWLFASKKGAFQVLVYMHRMNAFTLPKIRSKYLIPHISWLQNQVADLEKNSASLSKAELKKLDTYSKQLAECEEYDLLLKHMADKQITFDLDDGVTKNYAQFKDVTAGIK
jgi:hypothetical protein